MIEYSIVISVHNQREMLCAILESLKKQIKNPKVHEVVIADDYSTDGTEDFVKRLRFSIFLKYSRSSLNEGRARNRNRGFEKSAGKKVIFIDGDMVPDPGFVAAYLRAWEEFPGSVSIGSWRTPPEWKGGRWDRYLCTRGGLTMRHGDRVPGRYFTSGNFAAERTTLKQMSGFDTSFESWGGEDTDYGLRLEKSLVPIHFIPEALCYHYDRKSIDDIITQFERFGQSGYRRLVEKYPAESVFPAGWLIGLPDNNTGFLRKILSGIIAPLRSSPVLSVLKSLAKIQRGASLPDFCIDWLLYGHLAKGYRSAGK